MNTSGQALLIAVFIGLLLLIAVPIVVFLNLTGTLHHTGSIKRDQATTIAEEGITYAENLLANNWAQALSNPGAIPECTTAATQTDILGADGGHFRLTCSNNNNLYQGLQSYQVAVISTAWLPGANGGETPTRALEAFVSQRTISAALATGTHTSVALEMVNAPNLLGSLLVHWGPIVCLNAVPWLLVDPLDQATQAGGGAVFQGYPRKFSQGAITGNAYARVPDCTNTGGITTDQKEFWACSSIGFPPIINDAAYGAAALASGPLTAPIALGGVGTIFVTGSSITMTPGAVAQFDSGYSVPNSSTVIYVNGDAEFDDVRLDLQNGGAMIVTGNLTLKSPGAGVGAPMALNVSTTATREYAYWPATGSQWPCKGNATCTPAQAGATNGIQFRGFLWVKGNLIVQNPGPPSWFLAGAILVGDLQNNTGQQLIVQNGASLTLFYDDTVNHHIQTDSVQLQTDFLQDFAPS